MCSLTVLVVRMKTSFTRWGKEIKVLEFKNRTNKPEEELKLISWFGRFGVD